MWIIIVLLGFSKILGDSKYIITSPLRWEERDWVLAASMGVGSYGIVLIDEDIQDFMQSNRRDEISKICELFGNGAGASLIAGGFWIGGKVLDDKKAEQVGVMGIKSILISGVIVGSIKILGGRVRPYEGKSAFNWSGISTMDENLSFPSGHTSTAFALASVVSATYKNWFVDLLAYGIGAGVAWSRINDNEHWASDVIVGAIIGASVGRALVNKKELTF